MTLAEAPKSTVRQDAAAGIDADLLAVWRRQWQSPPKITPSAWAARYRKVSSDVSAESGPWRNERTPYLVEIMDAAADPDVDWIVLMKTPQIGGTEFLNNCLAYWIDCDPGRTLWVLPDEQAATETLAKRFAPLIDGTPRLARHKTDRKWDFTKTSIELDVMGIRAGWAGSAQSLAAWACRNVVFDETDKYRTWAGREADPMDLGEHRTTTYTDRGRKIMAISSPTTPHGFIARAFEACPDRRQYHVPCPHCGAYQMLAWQQVRFPHAKDLGLPHDRPDLQADRVQTERLAWYQCAACKGRIDERQRPWMLLRGLWVSQGRQVVQALPLEKPELAEAAAIVGPDRWRPRVEGPVTASRRIGFQISALYSPWRKLWDVAAAGIAARGNPEKMQNFMNGYLGEPFQEQVARVSTGLFRRKLENAPPPDLVPAWAASGVVVAAVDVQKTGFYYVLRVWGPNEQSQLLRYGHLASGDLDFRLLERATVEASFPVEALPGNQGRDLRMPVAMVMIDTGGGLYHGQRDITAEVYAWARRWPGIVFPAKGSSTPLHQIVKATRVDPRDGSGGPAAGQSLSLYLLDTNRLKDMLSGHIAAGPAQRGHWRLHSEVGDDYLLQMASEHKVLVRKAGRTSEVWQPVTRGAANHYWDCEVYQVAASHLGQFWAIEPAEASGMEDRRAWQRRTDQDEDEQGGWLRGRGQGWLRR